MKRLTLLLSLVISIGIFCQHLSAQENADTRRMTATITGRIIWDGHDLSHANVSVYRDEKLRELYISGIPKLGDGQFELSVEPGQYYLAAYVDVDKSGNFDAGDGFGIFGITQWDDEKQKYQIIKVNHRETIRSIEIPIIARATRTDGKFNLVPASRYRPTELQQFQADLRAATSGCSGTLSLALDEENPTPFALEGRKALILAYTDLSWKYRAGITTVSDSGAWILNLPPGKYYLMAIVDNNKTNKLDAGDDFGFYGVANMRKRGEFPEPVLISPNKLITDIGITISATYQQQKKTSQENSSILTGKVSLPEGTSARIEVYAESTLVTPIASGETAIDGTFHIALPPGEYYVIVNLDANKDGRYSEGDGLGGYGTVDITTQPPVPITLSAGENRKIDLLISAHYDANGHLHATPPGIETHIEQGIIAGRITWDGYPIQQGILTLSYAPDFRAPIAMPITVAGDGNYQVNALPGTYYVMAVMDANNDGKTGITDGVGIYGTRHPVRGEPAPVNVFPGQITSHINIEILASYIDKDGNMAEIEDGGRWEIKRRFGEPEDVFSITRNGRVNEEWKYWTKGIGFLWEANGVGWELGDIEEFTPKAGVAAKIEENRRAAPEPRDLTTTEQQDPPQTEQFPGVIYLTYDNIIWGISPDGMSVPFDTGHSPTVANDGTLTYQDPDGNVIIRSPDIPDGSLLLDRREMAKDVAISPDAQYVAYTRPDVGNRSRVVMRHIPSGSEYVVPSTALKSFTPAWNSDGSMLAYVTAGTIENPDDIASNAEKRRRNIYAFDQVKTSVEPIVVSPADDTQPAWSPADPNRLAFTRTDGNHQQIWLITYAGDGVPTERQLTQKGGSHPVWIPPEGHWILYENNGQLWRINTESPITTEAPLMHNGQIIFGHEPAILGGDVQTNTKREE
ncbi:MAG: hypothetical protein OXH00_22645 [Candidatus Poribacteria bacterium]|nr:hypothetical protein [Candidatus Poribacteria bacterium]